MKQKFYPRLAWDGIRKNRRFYTPYLMTCSGMVMLFYIIHYLAGMPALKAMPGGDSTTLVLGMGVWIVALFSLIFLIYTNSFLMRRRKKEFGLYNMLGMGKGNLMLLMLWETGIVVLISMGAGVFCGILLSKIAELGLTWALKGEITYDFTVNGEALKNTFLIFLPIFGGILAKSMWQVRKMSAVALLKSENTGDKPPRANYVLAIAGLIILGLAYYIAVSIQNPIAAMAWFFIAVGMVIVATYLLFISGSVVLCRLLQKNRRYYYRKNHFISVSSMVYRMKRNGAGLAAICILSTMVLVMIMGSSSLYFGVEDILDVRYPGDFVLRFDYDSMDSTGDTVREKMDIVLRELDETLGEYGAECTVKSVYRKAGATGVLQDGVMVLDPATVNGTAGDQLNQVMQLYFVPLEDYNRCMNQKEQLEEGEALIYCLRCRYENPGVTMKNGASWTVKKQVDSFMTAGNALVSMMPSVFVVVNDIDPAVEAINYELMPMGDYMRCRIELEFGVDTTLTEEVQIALGQRMDQGFEELCASGDGGYFDYSVDSRAEKRAEYSGTTAGIFFLGVFLSLVFMLAMILIIYYKQITEGYEDESRYVSMRKIGMTERDIRQNVNSQMLTVFLLPFAVAVLHECFAFPMVQKLLMMFNLQNEKLSLLVMAVSMLVFGVLYAVIYKMTSNAYVSIVSGKKEREI